MINDFKSTFCGNPTCPKCGVTYPIIERHECHFPDPPKVTPYEQSDAYWLRVFAGQALQGVLASPIEFETVGKNTKHAQTERVAIAISHAQKLLTAIRGAKDER